MSLLSIIGGALKPAFGLIDDLHTSTEEKLQLKLALDKAHNALAANALDYEKALNDAKASIITAETQSPIWITAAWRPLMMVMFGILIVLIATGIMDTDALNAVPDRLWGLLTIGIGGYIGARSAEKIIPQVLAASKSKDEV